jgi:hypothetical protein
MDLASRENCTRKLHFTAFEAARWMGKQSLIATRLLRRDKWLVQDDLRKINGMIHETRWKFGDSEGTYHITVSRIALLYEYPRRASCSQHLDDVPNFSLSL